MGKWVYFNRQIPQEDRDLSRAVPIGGIFATLRQAAGNSSLARVIQKFENNDKPGEHHESNDIGKNRARD